MKRKLLSILLCLVMTLSLLPTAALAEEAGATENYVTLELTYGSEVPEAVITAAKAKYENQKYVTCKAANEAFMALYGVNWVEREGGNPYLDVTDSTAPLRAYASNADAVTEVKYLIHGTLAGFTSLQSDGNNIDCTVGGNHQIPRTSISIIGVDGPDGSKAKLTDGNVQAYVAGGYDNMYTDSGKLTIDNIEFTTTNSTTVAASAANATSGSTRTATGEMEIKNCKFNGRLYVYDNFENTGMTYNIHNNEFDGSKYSGDSNAYPIFAQCRGGNELIIKNNNISGFARGINIDHANIKATIDGNTISITDAGRACIQLSSLTTAEIKKNTLNLTGGNAFTLHEKLLTMSTAPEVSITGNTITGTGYLIYDDAAANNKSFTSDKLTLTMGTGENINAIADTVDTTKGVKDGNTTALTGYVAAVAQGKDDITGKVAQVGNKYYESLEKALAELTAENHTLTLIDGSKWNAATPVYWKAGTQSGYAATLTAALTAAYKADAGDITIVCRPGADVGTMTHGHVADNLIIFGNNAFISDGECDLEVDTYKFSRATGAQANDGAYLNKNITITAYELDNLGVWGQRNTNHTVTVNLTDCDGTDADVNQRVYISGSNGVNNITLKGCDFDSSSVCAVYSNADGYIVVDGCTFDSVAEPININHKASGRVAVEVKESTFNGCGSTANSDKQYAAPVRFVNSGSGTMSANVSDCTIIDTKGANGDILLGDGRTGQKSNNLELTVSGTAANVQAQKPGYYDGEDIVVSKKAEKKLTAAESLHTTIADLLPVTEVDLDEFIKLVTSAGYSFDGTSVAGTGKKLTVKWSPVSGCFNLNGGHHQLGEDCPKIAATGNTPNRWQDPYAQYQLFASATGLSISNVNFVYVPDKVSVCMNGSWGGKDVTPTLAELQLNNSGDTSFAGCTFDKVTVSPYGKGNNNGNTNEQNIASFTDCEFANVTDKYAIKDVYAGNVTVENCTFNNCGGGIYLEGDAKKGTIDISDNNFTNIGTKGLIQFSAKGDYTKADIILDGNTASNCGPILRQLNQGIADNDVLSKNLKGDLTGLGGELTFTGDSVKKTSGAEPSQPTIYTVKFRGSDVADKKVVSGTTIDLPTVAKPGYTFNGWYDGRTKVSSPYEVTKDVTLTASWSYKYSGGSSSYDPTYSVSTPSKTENGSVTVSPKNASKGDTVTVTVKPDSGYVLETLTVTDKNGNELKLKDKGNGKYTFTMPAGKVEVKATFMEDNSMLNFFYDVPNGAYFYEAVKWAVKNGITTGVGNDLFAPEQPCTRAQIVTFLWRAAGSPEPKGTAAGMTDVVSGSYYEKAVAWAIENGITTGTTISTFSPDATCTRAQAVTFLARALNAKATSVAEFSDVPTDSYFADAVAWAAANGVTEGIGGGKFAPDDFCTRGQIVTFLYRAYQGK